MAVYKNNKIVASLSIYIPSFRFNNQKRAKMVKLGVAAANRISATLSQQKKIMATTS